ncbi:hypothetical protein ACFXP3_19435 [Streptomyces sp. NPDC059096]|uniref:hypothetical protein n=1 Tax=Streptomyces sp. NPDC059096 TaxID=3346727 RepID=UPI00367DE195
MADVVAQPRGVVEGGTGRGAVGDQPLRRPEREPYGMDGAALAQPRVAGVRVGGEAGPVAQGEVLGAGVLGA